ncbi:MAG: hypothetical protein RLY71_2409 [Pseudomonadota bacterium]
MPIAHEHAVPLHVCIATGQNAANLIPLKQLQAVEVLILQTPAMRDNAAHLETALRQEGRAICRQDFDDAGPAAIEAAAQAVAEQLDGRHVVLHVTGGTKLMVLALRDSLRLLETGSGRLDIVYADTPRQQLDWLGSAPRTEPMADVLDLREMLLVQGYCIESDTRPAATQSRASARAGLTRELGDNAARYGKFFSALATLASLADSSGGLTQEFQFAPGGANATLLNKAADQGLLQWAGGEQITFADEDAAHYFAGAWLEEFVFLKLSGLARPGRYGTNVVINSTKGKGVRNEIDAILIQRNRALLIECKTGRQHKAQDALYKLAQLRQSLGGSVAGALYLSAQPVPDDVRRRADEYRIAVLAGNEIGQLVPRLKEWQTTP